jgi:uroporphyrinogen-III decarboxylase
MDKTLEKQYRERIKRINDAIALKVPDRVPTEIGFDYFPAKFVGKSFEIAYKEYDAWLDAYKKTLLYLKPDALFYQGSYTPDLALELIDPRPFRWPGHGVAPDSSHQFVEGEWMKADEYDAFLSDHADYLLRKYLPRVVGAAAPFEKLPDFMSLGYGYFAGMALAEIISQPEIAGAIETLMKAGRELREWRPKMDAFKQEIINIGCPVNAAGLMQAPFDAISDFLRGMHGTMLDMFRQPDKLLQAIEKIKDRTLRTISQLPPPTEENNRIFMPLHRGAHGFMSLKQFETFYWPSLKAVILAIMDKGYNPGIFFEGDYTSRLEYLLELPKGRVLAHLDSTDIFKAKEVLGGHMCIRGNVPSSLLEAGTPDDVKAYCKKLIDVVGRDGGLIVCPRSSMDSAKPENLKAMIDFTREYGVYK